MGPKYGRCTLWNTPISKAAAGNCLETIVNWYNAWELWLWPNRAADPYSADIFERALPFTAHYWEGKRADGYYLDLLAVDPDAQKHGYGKQLVQWGLMKAKEAHVCASVVSSFGSDPFYLKCGFQEVVGNATEGEGNPLNECEAKGGNILFVDP